MNNIKFSSDQKSLRVLCSESKVNNKSRDFKNKPCKILDDSKRQISNPHLKNLVFYINTIDELSDTGY